MTLKYYAEKVNMVLLNKAPELDPELLYNIEAGELLEEDEIYQFYVINKLDGEWLVNNFKNCLVLFYSEALDSYILGTKFLDSFENIKNNFTY